MTVRRTTQRLRPTDPGIGEIIVAFLIEYLPILMFVALGLLLFSGYPVAFVLGGIGLAFAVIGGGIVGIAP